jgi:uncharacterized membrane protein YoaK (UPF0700 family)
MAFLNKKTMKKRGSNALAIGVLIGTVIGTLTDDKALWISIGIALGAAYKYRINKKQNETN